MLFLEKNLFSESVSLDTDHFCENVSLDKRIAVLATLQVLFRQKQKTVLVQSSKNKK